MHRLVDGAHIGLYPLYGWRTLNIRYLSPWSTPWIQWNDGLQGTDRSPNMLHWQLSAWQWWKEGCGSVRTSRTIPGAEKNVGDPAKMVLGGSSVFQIHVCIHLSHYLYLSLSPSLHRRLGEELARGKSKNIYKYLHVIIYICHIKVWHYATKVSPMLLKQNMAWRQVSASKDSQPVQNWNQWTSIPSMCMMQCIFLVVS